MNNYKPRKYISRGRVLPIILFFVFTPFFSPLPTVTDLQPFSLILIILWMVYDNKYIAVDAPILAIILFSALSFFYVNTESMYIDFRKALGFPAAVIFYVFFRAYAISINQKILFFIVVINFLALTIHYFFPLFFSETLGVFVRTVKMLETDGPRGASGFAAEPGFMGVMAVFYMATSLLLKDLGQNGKHYKYSVFLSILMIVMTKSGSGFMYLFLFLVLYYSRASVKFYFTGLLLFASIYFIVINIDLGRGGSAIALLLNDPSALLTKDESVGARLINIIVGIISLYEFPFGLGWGGYETAYQYIQYHYRLSDFVAGTGGNISAFALYSTTTGLFYYFFIFYFVYKALARKKKYHSLPYLFLALTMHIASFSVAFPMVWFLFAVLHSRNHELRRQDLNIIKKNII